MRALVQRVREGAVHIGGAPVASIGAGYVVLVGFGGSDQPELMGTAQWNRFIDKITCLRLFPDAHGPINATLMDHGGEVLVVSQFTLYADIRKGRRPSFSTALAPDKAQRMYDAFVATLASRGCTVRTGIFGADMDVHLVNWGPVTIWVDSEEL